jgi:hypothetical protein
MCDGRAHNAADRLLRKLAGVRSARRYVLRVGFGVFRLRRHFAFHLANAVVEILERHKIPIRDGPLEDHVDGWLLRLVFSGSTASVAAGSGMGLRLEKLVMLSATVTAARAPADQKEASRAVL